MRTCWLQAVIITSISISIIFTLNIFITMKRWLNRKTTQKNLLIHFSTSIFNRACVQYSFMTLYHMYICVRFMIEFKVDTRLCCWYTSEFHVIFFNERHVRTLHCTESIGIICTRA